MLELQMRVRQGESMRYSNKHIKDMNQYSKSIGLNDQLFEYPKSQEQADALLLLQEDGFAVMSMGYIKMNHPNIHEATKIEEAANKKLRELIRYCRKINSSYALTVEDQLKHIVLPPLSEHRTLSVERKGIRKEYLLKLKELGFKSKSEEIANILLELINDLINDIE